LKSPSLLSRRPANLKPTNFELLNFELINFELLNPTVPMLPTPPDSPFTLRFGTEDDLPLILTFIEELAAYEKLRDEVVATEERLRLALFGTRPYAEVILAFRDETPAGFALFFHTFSTFLGQPGLYLEDLFVRPPHRRQGLGRLLLRTLATLAVERGCGRLEWAVLDWNEPAIRFYEELGATPMDEWTVYRLTGDALERLATDE
jgi:GNAT superfamily N-acetyltransferase